MSEDRKDEKSVTYKEYSKFLDTHLAKPERAKLTEISPVASFNKEIQDILQSFYDHSDSTIKRLGSAFNAIYTQQNNVFTLSLRMMNDLVKADVAHHGLKSCDDEAFNDLVHRALSSGLFARLREPVRRSPGQPGKAGLYKLVHPAYFNPLKNLMGQDLADARENRYIAWWDRGGIGEEEKPLSPEAMKAREIADDLFKRK